MGNVWWLGFLDLNRIAPKVIIQNSPWIFGFCTWVAAKEAALSQIQQSQGIKSLGLHNDHLLWVLIPLFIMISIIELWFLMAIVTEAHQRRFPPYRSLKENLVAHALPLLNTFFRSATQVLMWTLALVIPGIVRFLRLIWAPIITVIEPENPDPVQASILASRGQLLGALAVLLLTWGLGLGVHFGLPILRDEGALPLLYHALVGLTGLIEIYTYLGLYCVYLRIREGAGRPLTVNTQQ